MRIEAGDVWHDMRKLQTHHLFALVLVAAWLTNAWSSELQSAQEFSEQQLLPALFGDPVEHDVMIAEQGYLDDTNFFVKYRTAGKFVYAGGNWRDRVELADPAAPAGEDFTVPFLMPLEYHQSEVWPDLPADARRLRILGVERWREFRDWILVSILPIEGQVGVVLSFENDDYFLYYDENHKFNATLVQDKPADYRIADILGFDEFLHRGLPILEEYLAQQDIREREIVFNTGDRGAYSLPFLYGNLDRRIAVFVRFVPESMRRAVGGPVIEKVQTAGHVGRSHISGLVTRPLSSIHRLFFIVTHTAIDTLRPNWLLSLQTQPAAPLVDGPGMDLNAWEAKLDTLTGRRASKGTIRYLVDGEEFFTRFIDAIVSAEESVYLRTYIFDNDDYAIKIGDLLKRRSNEGIDVKVLLDGLGTIFATGEASPSQPKDYEPPASVHEYLEKDSRVDVRQAINPWLASDHVKTTIIDQRYAFLGGMNIGREYRYDWHDLMMEIHGPVVNILLKDFRDAWALAGALGDLGYLTQMMQPAPKTAEDVGSPLRVLFTRPDSSEIFEAQLEAIRRANKYIYIQNAYFTDDTILYELAKARRRGVDVRVIIPLESDRGLLTRANAIAANALLASKIRVFIYPGMSHIKAAVFDGWVCLGSANLDRLSLRINREINLATSDSETADRLIEKIFDHDFARSPELTTPFPDRWMDHLVETVGDYIF
jgi:cardiolipin synthase